MSNRVALVTFFRDNYGSALQCYATKTFLQKNGYECDVLYEYSYGYEKLKARFKYLSKIALLSLLYRDFSKNRKEIKQSDSKSALTKESKIYIDWFCETIYKMKLQVLASLSLSCGIQWERPECIKARTLKLVGTDEETIYTEFNRLLTDKAAYDAMAKASNPYVDGRACESIESVICNGQI